MRKKYNTGDLIWIPSSAVLWTKSHNNMVLANTTKKPSIGVFTGIDYREGFLEVILASSTWFVKLCDISLVSRKEKENVN